MTAVIVRVLHCLDEGVLVAVAVAGCAFADDMAPAFQRYIVAILPFWMHLVLHNDRHEL